MSLDSTTDLIPSATFAKTGGLGAGLFERRDEFLDAEIAGRDDAARDRESTRLVVDLGEECDAHRREPSRTYLGGYPESKNLATDEHR